MLTHPRPLPPIQQTPTDVLTFIATSARDLYLSIANPYKLVHHLSEDDDKPASRPWWVRAVARAPTPPPPAPSPPRIVVPAIRIVTQEEVLPVPAGLRSVRVTPPLTARDKVASARRKAARAIADRTARCAVVRRERQAVKAAKKEAKSVAKKAGKTCGPPKPAVAVAPRVPAASWRLRSAARVVHVSSASSPAASTPASPSPAVTPVASQLARMMSANARLGERVAALTACTDRENARLSVAADAARARADALAVQLAVVTAGARADVQAAVRQLDARLDPRCPETAGVAAAAIAAAARAAAARRADVEARANKGK